MGLQLCIIEGHTVSFKVGKHYIGSTNQNPLRLYLHSTSNAENSQAQIHLGTYLIMMKTGRGV